jgi:toxin ParE1/3/4
VQTLSLSRVANCQLVVPDVLEAAAREMVHAASDYESWRFGYGDRFLDEVSSAFRFVDRFPFLGSPWLLEGVPEGVRRVVLRAFPYSVVYVTDPRAIVIAIAHASMHPLYWIDRLDEAK